MSLSCSPGTYRFGDYQFEAETGELRRLVEESGDAEEGTSRLPPQPAKLLQLLLSKEGDLLSKEEIRETLWPDTHIDFESSLHFCVCQVRAALEDDADSGRYIETLPRRGYRVVVPVVRQERREAVAASRERSTRSGNLQLILWAISLPLGLLAVAFIVGGLREPAGPRVVEAAVGPPSEAIRLAILPFAAGIENPRLEPRAARLSEGLTVAFTRAFPPSAVQTLGPLSTAPYRELPFPRLDAMERELDVDLVLNARIVEGGADTEPSVEGILVELIQTDNGAHLWAEFYPASTDWLAIEDSIAEEIRPAIDSLAEHRAAQGRD